MADYTTARTQTIIDQGGPDVAALSDQAKRIEATRPAAVQANAAQGLKAATGGGGKVPPPLDHQVAGAILQHLRRQDQTEIDPVGNRQEYMLELSQRITEMEKKAADVKKSGTSNVVAQNTYTQIAALLKKSLYAMQSEDVGAPSAEQAGQMAAQNQAAQAQAPAAQQRVVPPPMPQGGMSYGGR
jgi:hypothetical protein